MIVVVDYKMGNIGSIQNMLKKLDIEAMVSHKPEDLLAADKLILPGVGSFDTGMSHLHELGLIEPLKEKVLKQQTPILGICIGMQLMAKSSEEGSKPGLGWFDAEVIKFDFEKYEVKLRIPCVGWNIVHPKRASNLMSCSEEERFYFVHSYHFNTSNQDDIIATATYGFDYPVAINHGNIYGVQFHPEKSHKFGLRLFKNFVEQC